MNPCHRCNSRLDYLASLQAMDLRQLHALLAVAEHRSFSAAARALHTVQSNVSTHVARLEREVGAQLIDRGRSELTTEGAVVASRARRMIAELRAIEDDLVALRDELSGTVRAGVIGTTARWLVPPLLDSLTQEHPRVTLQIIEATTTSLAPQLLGGQLDIAVVNLPVVDPDIDTEPLFLEDRIVVAPLDHPLASCQRVDIADLAGYEILLPPKGTSFRDEIEADARQARVELSTRAEVDGLRLLSSLAFQGFAPALVPASAAPAWLQGDFCRIPVDGFSRRGVGLAVRRRFSASAPTRAVAEIIRTVVADTGADQSGLTPVSGQGADIL